ncbi:MAG: M48 family metalloprotease [Conexivisphaerales archaeon]
MKCIENELTTKLDNIAQKTGAFRGLSRGCRYYTGDYPWLARYDIFRKRIVINEKFLNLLTIDEALAVLVHEEAHAVQRAGYLLRAMFVIIFSTVLIFTITQIEFAILSLLPQQAGIALLLALTLVDLGIILPLVIKVASCAFNLKRFEMEADALAAREVGKDQLISALEKAQGAIRHIPDSAPRKLFRWWINYVDSCVHLPYEKRLKYIREV